MLHSILVKNYKSIKEALIQLGQFNVLIGENGAGKSNFLEVLASYSAIIDNNFTNEFMLSRGIRVIETSDLFSCFEGKTKEKIFINVSDKNGFGCKIRIAPSDQPFSPFIHEIELITPNFKNPEEDLEEHDIKDLNFPTISSKYDDIWNKYGSFDNFLEKLKNMTEEIKKLEPSNEDNNNDKNKFDYEKHKELQKTIALFETLNGVREIAFNYNKIQFESKNGPSNFIIFSPELSSLRSFSSDSQIEPLGVNGEGLLKLLQVMKEHEPENFQKVCETVEVFQWVEKIIIEPDSNNLEHRIKIVDRFMGKEIDHRSANEGFLFVLFYATLFSSKYTPKSFAVDNIDASLNPKLCRVLIKELVKLAKDNGKQAFVTTHNPAILDGLDLHDSEQRLFVAERDDEGATTLRRVGVDDLPKPKRNGETIKLSEAFMRGHLGGLPTNF